MKNIYIIRNDINKKVYIGQTKSTLEDRLNKHFSRLNFYKKSNMLNAPIFYIILNEFGRKHIKIELLETCSDEDAFEREQFYINKYKSSIEKYGYNTRNSNMESIDIEKDIEEINNKIIELYVNDRISITRISKQVHKDHRYVKNLLEKKGLLRVTGGGGEATRETYSFPISALDKKTMKPIMSFNSQYEAAEYMIANKKTDSTYDNTVKRIQMVARGTGGKSAYGYIWKQDDLSNYEKNRSKLN